MKLLSIATWKKHHDSSISYFDGEKLHYYKSERILQEKHHHIKPEDYTSVIREVFDLHWDNLDSICFCCRQYDGNKKLPHPLNDLIGDPRVVLLDHHVGHMLSVELFNGKPDVSIVIDGDGGDLSWVVYKDDKIIDKGIHNECGSFGHGMEFLGRTAELPGNVLDLAGKVMGLQSYGKINDEFLKNLMQYDEYSIGGKKVFEGDSDRLFAKNDKLFILDWIKTIHYRCEKIILSLFEKHANTNDVIHYSGGVAQNVIWNTSLKKRFPNLIVMPHCGDEGLTLGGIEHLRRLHNLPKIDLMNYPFSQMDESPDSIISEETSKRVAKLLSVGKIVAYYQGHGEIGPRALGNRSILMDPRIKDGKNLMNIVKKRENYRPFGASVLERFKKKYFDLDFENPYMLYVGSSMFDDMPSITHVDGTCRVQTVKGGHFGRLLEDFYDITGCPALLNTSLNISGKPISGSIKNAFEEFENKYIDVLVVGDDIYTK